MKTVYLGTSEFAAAILRTLADSPHRPTLVVSRPDRPQGRGRHLAPPPVVLVARELGLETFQPEAVNSPESIERIAAAEPERLALCAFGALIKEPLLSQFAPILNVHPSLLPRWRGAAPLERALLAGDERTGVSIMALTAGLDDGPVARMEAMPIESEDDYGSLAAKLESLGAQLLIEALDASSADGAGLDWQPQDESATSYAEKITAADRRLDPSEGAVASANRVRALAPHIGAYIELQDGSRLGVWQARALSGDGTGEAGGLDLSGAVVAQPIWHTAAGDLVLDSVQPPGRKRMSGDDFLRGQRR